MMCPCRGGEGWPWHGHRGICHGLFASTPEGPTRRARREGSAHPGGLGRSRATPYLLPGRPSNVMAKIKIQSIFTMAFTQLEIFLLVEQECDPGLGKLTR